MEEIYREYRELGPVKALLLERLLAQEGLALGDVMIPPRPRDREFYPLDPAQARLFFFEQLNPGSAVFNLPYVVRLGGPLSRERLSQAIATVTTSHEVFRLSFHVNGSQLVQRLSESAPVPVDLCEIREADAQERMRRIQTLVQAQICKPFELGQAPLLRVTMIDDGAGDHYIVFITHHLIADDWSVRVLVREIGRCYDRLGAGTTPPRDAARIQYLDYVLWQEERTRARSHEPELEYWQRRFGGTLPRLSLPADFKRPTKRKFRGAVYRFELDAATLTRLKATSQRHDCTLFVTLLTAFKVLVAAISSRHDIPVAVPITGRNRVELETLLGIVGNTLILYTRLQPDRTLAETLQDVRATTLEAFAHQNVPFDLVVARASGARKISDGLMYDLGFQVLDHRNETYDVMAFQEGNWNVPRSLPFDLTVDTQVAKCDLFLCAWECDGRLVCSLDYDSDLFKRATVTRWMQQLQSLLTLIINEPGCRLADALRRAHT